MNENIRMQSIVSSEAFHAALAAYVEAVEEATKHFNATGVIPPESEEREELTKEGLLAAIDAHIAAQLSRMCQRHAIL